MTGARHSALGSKKATAINITTSRWSSLTMVPSILFSTAHNGLGLLDGLGIRLPFISELNVYLNPAITNSQTDFNGRHLQSALHFPNSTRKTSLVLLITTGIFLKPNWKTSLELNNACTRIEKTKQQLA